MLHGTNNEHVAGLLSTRRVGTDDEKRRISSFSDSSKDLKPLKGGALVMPFEDGANVVQMCRMNCPEIPD